MPQESDLFILATIGLIFQYLNSEHALYFPNFMVSAKCFCCNDFILLSPQLSRKERKIVPTFQKETLNSDRVRAFQGRSAGE